MSEVLEGRLLQTYTKIHRQTEITIQLLTKNHQKIDHVELNDNSARNSQLLRQIDVGTLIILFERPTRLLVVGTCTT